MVLCFTLRLKYHHLPALDLFRPTHRPLVYALACLLPAGRVCASAYPLAHPVLAQMFAGSVDLSPKWQTLPFGHNIIC